MQTHIDQGVIKFKSWGNYFWRTLVAFWPTVRGWGGGNNGDDDYDDDEYDDDDDDDDDDNDNDDDANNNYDDHDN